MTIRVNNTDSVIYLYDISAYMDSNFVYEYFLVIRMSRNYYIVCGS